MMIADVNEGIVFCKKTGMDTLPMYSKVMEEIEANVPSQHKDLIRGLVTLSYVYGVTSHNNELWLDSTSLETDVLDTVNIIIAQTLTTQSFEPIKSISDLDYIEVTNKHIPFELEDDVHVFGAKGKPQLMVAIGEDYVGIKVAGDAMTYSIEHEALAFLQPYTKGVLVYYLMCASMLAVELSGTTFYHLVDKMFEGDNINSTLELEVKPVAQLKSLHVDTYVPVNDPMAY